MNPDQADPLTLCDRCQWPAPEPPAPPGSLLIAAGTGRCTSSVPGLIEGPVHWCALDKHPDDAHQCRCGLRWGTDCLG